MTARPLYFVQTDRATNGEPYTGNLYGTDYVEGAHGPYLTAKTAKWMGRKVRRGQIEEWVAIPKAEYDALDLGGAADGGEDCAEACVPVDRYNEKVLELNGLRGRLAELEAAIKEIDADRALDASADASAEGGDGATEPAADEVEVRAPDGERDAVDASTADRPAFDPVDPETGATVTQPPALVVSPGDATWTSLQKAVYDVKDRWDWTEDYDSTVKREQAEEIYRLAVEKGVEVLPLEAK